MKTNTNKQNKPSNRNPSTLNPQPETQNSGTGLEELKNRSEQLVPEQSKAETESTEQEQEAKATSDKTCNLQPSTCNPTKSIRPYVNFAEREYNRKLPLEKILAVLKRWMPRQYELAEVVGSWIWITFQEPPTEQVRADLSQLGFHWNNTRKCWQHPCGEWPVRHGPRGTQEPREKYSTYHPADNAYEYTGPARTADQVAA